jgi:hypothetical protein
MKRQTPLCGNALLDLIWFSSCNGYTSGLRTYVTKIDSSSDNVYLVSSQMRYIHFFRLLTEDPHLRLGARGASEVLGS